MIFFFVIDPFLSSWRFMPVGRFMSICSSGVYPSIIGADLALLWRGLPNNKHHLRVARVMFARGSPLQLQHGLTGFALIPFRLYSVFRSGVPVPRCFCIRSSLRSPRHWQATAYVRPFVSLCLSYSRSAFVSSLARLCAS